MSYAQIRLEHSQKNELTLAEPIPFNNYSKDDVILFAALASEKNGDAIDNAIFKVLNGSSKLSSKINEFKIIDFTPFDPVIKRTEAVVGRDKRRFRVAKGAP